MFSSTALLITRDASLAKSVQDALNSVANLDLQTVADLQEACPLLQCPRVVLLLTHLARRASAAPLVQFLQHVAGLRRPIATIVLSDENRPEEALALLRQGAADYLDRPLDLRHLAYRADMLTVRARYQGVQPATAAPPLAAGEPPELVPLMEQVRRVAPQKTTLLLTGETGTGKTRLAHLIHELSPRRAEPFVVIDCGALSPNLIESEMFGHVKGAFTGADHDRAGKFAAAGSGTLLLDEINALPPALQCKLLRAVDEHVFEPVGTNKPVPVQARIIAASNQPLAEEVAGGRFRADLYYRLNVVGFYLPPLRERMGLIDHLVPQFLEEFARHNERAVYGISPEALRALQAYPWPGNVRELRHEIERAVALCPGSVIQVADLSEAVQAAAAESVFPAAQIRIDPGHVTASLARSKEEAEAACIAEALRVNNNNRQRAAASLGISRMTLYTKLRRYGLMPTATTN